METKDAANKDVESNKFLFEGDDDGLQFLEISSPKEFQIRSVVESETKNASILLDGRQENKFINEWNYHLL